MANKSTFTIKGTNREGLTFSEFIYACGYAVNKFPLHLLRAWQEGEDPSDHRKAKDYAEYLKKK